MTEVTRCNWAEGNELLSEYHDSEWGRPTIETHLLFEKMCLEGFQSGLSWLTILKKRDNFRQAFSEFDFRTVSQYTEKDVDRLLADSGIIRHRGKIEAAINNAIVVESLEKSGLRLAELVWKWASAKPLGKGKPVPSSTENSSELAKELKRLGWKFFGPTTAYAFMQSEGLVNDHQPECHSFEICEKLRQPLLKAGI